LPPPVTCPYTRSKRLCPSYSLASKSVKPPHAPLPYRQARHSTLKMRLGLEPVVDVKIPSVELTELRVSRWSQYAKVVLLKAGAGRQVLADVTLEPANWILPLELACSVVKGALYRS